MSIFNPRRDPRAVNYDEFWLIMNMFGYENPGAEKTQEEILALYQDASRFFDNLTPREWPQFDVLQMRAFLKDVVIAIEGDLKHYFHRIREQRREQFRAQYPTRVKIRKARLGTVEPSYRQKMRTQHALDKILRERLGF